MTMVFGFHTVTVFMLVCSLVATTGRQLHSANLSAGVAKVDITDRGAGPVNDRKPLSWSCV